MLVTPLQKAIPEVMCLWRRFHGVFQHTWICITDAPNYAEHLHS